MPLTGCYDSLIGVEKRLIPIIAWLWHDIALYWGNFLPLPGTKRYVGRKISECLPLPFARSILAVGKVVFACKTLLSILPFTLHLFAWNPDKHRGCERWRVLSTLHHRKRLICSRLRHKGEGWRVFLKVAFYAAKGWRQEGCHHPLLEIILET